MPYTLDHFQITSCLVIWSISFARSTVYIRALRTVILSDFILLYPWSASLFSISSLLICGLSVNYEESLRFLYINCETRAPFYHCSIYDLWWYFFICQRDFLLSMKELQMSPSFWAGGRRFGRGSVHKMQVSRSPTLTCIISVLEVGCHSRPSFPRGPVSGLLGKVLLVFFMPRSTPADSRGILCSNSLECLLTPRTPSASDKV